MTSIQNVSFGSTTNEVAQNTEVSEKKHLVDTSKLTQPIKDEFKKAYGEDAKPTPKLVADFTADKILKVAGAAVGATVAIAVARGKMNGFTESAAKNIKELMSAANEKKAGIVKKGIQLVKGTMADLRASHAQTPEAIERMKDAMKSEGLGTIVKDKILRSTELDSASKISKAVDKLVKNSNVNAKVKSFIGKIGIKNGYNLADTVAAIGISGVASKGINKKIANATSANNSTLASEENLKNGTADMTADAEQNLKVFKKMTPEERQEKFEQALDVIGQLADVAEAMSV